MSARASVSVGLSPQAYGPSNDGLFILVGLASLGGAGLATLSQDTAPRITVEKLRFRFTRAGGLGRARDFFLCVSEMFQLCVFR